LEVALAVLVMSNLRVNEGSKSVGLSSVGYGLSLSTVIDVENPIESEIRHVNEAIVNWLNSRESACVDMALVFIASDVLHDEIVATVTRLFGQDIKCFQYLKNVDIKLIVMDMIKKVSREFSINC